MRKFSQLLALIAYRKQYARSAQYYKK